MRHLPAFQGFASPWLLRSTSALASMCAFVLWQSPASRAQQAPVHINPVIAKLAAGKTVYGLSTGDLSLANARATARSDVDFVYVDMEHNPLDFPALHMFPR